MLRRCFYTFCSLFILSIHSIVHAGQVIKVNDKKVYIKFGQEDEGTFAEDDIFYIVNANGKKTGIIQLKKVKGFKAIGILSKGKASTGDGTLFKGVSAKKTKPSEVAESKRSRSESNNSTSRKQNQNQSSRWGVLFGYATAGQDVTQTISTTTTVSQQTGSSMSLRGVYTYPIMDSIELDLMAGIEMFKVQGQGYIQPNTSTLVGVTTDIKYLAFDGLLKWNLFEGTSFGAHLLGGVAVLYPASTASDTVKNITTMGVGEFGAGVQYNTGSYIIPLDFIYYYIPGADVKTKLMGVRVGVIF